MFRAPLTAVALIAACAAPVALSAATNAPSRPGPTLAVEDTMRTELPEVLVKAPRLSLNDILDRVARGEAHRDSLIHDQVYTVTARVVRNVTEPKKNPELISETVSKVYKKKPDKVRGVTLKRWKLKPDKDGDENVEIRYRADTSEELVNFAFRPEGRREFKFRIAGRDLFGDRLVYRIAFEPRSALDAASPSGVVWVDTNEFVVVRQEVSFDRSPVPLLLKNVDRMVIERERVDGIWVLRRVLLRARFTLNLPEVGRSIDMSLQFTDYAINRGIDDAIFAKKDEVSVARRTLAIAAVFCACTVGAAHAEDAPSDTLLHRFLRSMADSTDAYFGMSATRPDTSGLDSVLAYRLAHGDLRQGVRLTPELSPWLGFNRVDGGVMGGGLSIGRRSRFGRVGGRAAWANGPNVVLGEGTYEKGFYRDESNWTFGFGAGRLTHGMDSDFGELRLAQVRAILSGSDTKRYYRRDGFRVRVGRETPIWRASVEYRDQLESPLPVTATWNLMGSTPEIVDNLPAAFGHVHELEYASTVRFGRLPISGEVDYATSGDAIGSDFEYRRLRLALAGDLAVGRWLAIVPQLSWGRVTGQALPQNAFYLGGSRTLRHLKGSSLGGSRLALARIDLIETPDLLALAHIPHPDALPLQGAIFAGAGAVWGHDPYGGPTTDDGSWPGNELWKTEAGISLLYRPGIPDPNGFLRFSYAWPLGPSDESGRFTITFARGLDLLRPLE